MKKVLLIVAVAVMALLADSQLASAGKCGGGRGGCGSKKSCRSSRGGRHSQCSSGCQSCGYQGCGYQGCGSCGTPCGAPCGAHVLGTIVTSATVVVNLPEDAQLTIDGEPTTSTSANRVFVTPALEGGKEYQYTFKAQVVRDGKTQTTTQQVTVRAGEVSRVELKVNASSVAAQ